MALLPSLAPATKEKEPDVVPSKPEASEIPATGAKSSKSISEEQQHPRVDSPKQTNAATPQAKKQQQKTSPKISTAPPQNQQAAQKHEDAAAKPKTHNIGGDTVGDQTYTSDIVTSIRDAEQDAARVTLVELDQSSDEQPLAASLSSEDDINYIAILQEYLQKRGLPTPEYEKCTKVQENPPMFAASVKNLPENNRYASEAPQSSVKKAKQSAAKVACREMDICIPKPVSSTSKPALAVALSLPPATKEKEPDVVPSKPEASQLPAADVKSSKSIAEEQQHPKVDSPKQTNAASPQAKQQQQPQPQNASPKLSTAPPPNQQVIQKLEDTAVKPKKQKVADAVCPTQPDENYKGKLQELLKKDGASSIPQYKSTEVDTQKFKSTVSFKIKHAMQTTELFPNKKMAEEHLAKQVLESLKIDTHDLPSFKKVLNEIDPQSPPKYVTEAIDPEIAVKEFKSIIFFQKIEDENTIVIEGTEICSSKKAAEQSVAAVALTFIETNIKSFFAEK